MLDRAAAYKTSQILTASPVERVVLLYRGAIRFATLQVNATEQGSREQAHIASLRAQEIVSGLRETLDLSAGPIAAQLDALYDFCLRRLMDANLGCDPKPAREAITVLSGLLEAWAQLAGTAGSAPAGATGAVAPVAPGLVSGAHPASAAPRGIAAYATAVR